MNSRVDRRRFVKYVGAAAIAVGGAAAGYYLYDIGLARKTEVAAPTVTQTATTVDYPPYADFKYKPYYLCPTDQQTIEFTNMSYDLGGEPLTNTWLVDGNAVGRERDYLTKLPVGEHVVDLQVSDGKQARVKSATVTVEPDQIYPTKPLYVRYNGTSYFIGPMTPEWPTIPTPTREEMDEQLDAIHDDLGCNAIILCGGKDDEDNIVECAKLAIAKGFQRVCVQPRYISANVDETIESIGRFASKVRELRESSETVVYCVGHEFTLETNVLGDSFWERYQVLKQGGGYDRIRAVLPEMFRRIIRVCGQGYGYPITYASLPIYEHDLVPWSNPIFESVGVNVYIQPLVGQTKDWCIDFLESVKRFRKPVHATDWGVWSYEGADQYGGWSPLYGSGRPYDESPQRRYIEEYCNMLNRARIDGCYWIQYNDTLEIGHELYNPRTRQRKQGFYMYKSYQRVS